MKLKFWQDNNDPIIKELLVVASTVRSFEKRIATSESKIDSLRESVDKRIEGLKSDKIRLCCGINQKSFCF